MTKKLKLSEFLANYTAVEKVATSDRDIKPVLSYPLEQFYRQISLFKGHFCIDGIVYTHVLPSMTNLYFFNEQTEQEHIVIFEPIIDIKEKNNTFTVFYYPETVINILLKESNEQESKDASNP